jgi:hypothetical protein
MTAITGQVLDDVWQMVEAELRDLRAKSFDELRLFVDEPKSWKAEIRGKSVDFGIWAQVHEGSRLAVLVEGRRNFILGISRVAANGFYKAPEGTVTPFEEKDLWAHGY